MHLPNFLIECRCTAGVTFNGPNGPFVGPADLDDSKIKRSLAWVPREPKDMGSWPGFFPWDSGVFGHADFRLELFDV